MRILHIYKDYFPVIGGIENHVRALAEAQASGGHDVSVLVTSPAVRGDRGRRGGVEVIRAGRLATVASTPLSAALPAALRSMRPDVTHLHSPYPVGEASWLAFGRRPMVLTYHSDVVRQRVLGRLFAPVLRRVLAAADRVLATSPRYVDTSPFLSAVRHKVVVVPLGVDCGRFAPAGGSGRTGDVDPASRDGRTPARARPARSRVLFVGRLRYYKGLEVLIDALTRLPDVDLVVVGTGPMGDAWRRHAQIAGVADRVEWLGAVADDDLPAVLAGADVFALPATARSEAFGTVLLEAMAAGLPVVSTELGTGTSWVNQDGVTGRVVAPGSAEALAGAIAGLLADDALRRRMGAAARRRALEEFSLERMIERVEDVYRAVARPRVAAHAMEVTR